MRYALTALLAVVATVAVLAASASSSGVRRCKTGSALGFIAIRSEPLYLVGTIPSSFTFAAGYFSRRYNCRLKSVGVRRAGLGLYDVVFPGLRPAVLIVSAISDEGVSASAWPVGDGVVRVALRGPLGGSDVAARRDVAFSLVLY